MSLRLNALLLLLALPVAAQPGADGESSAVVAQADGAFDSAEFGARGAPMYYSLQKGATVYRGMDDDVPYVALDFQEPVTVLSFHGPWTRVRTGDGARGYVRSDALSDVWIRVDKSDKTVYVYRGETLESTIPADLAYNFFNDKRERGSPLRPDHWRTPEGRFYVVTRNPQSQFHRAWVLNYPTPEHAEYGIEAGIISPSEYDRINEAAASLRPPPMDTALGGFIEIHGYGTGARTSWTQGCIAIPNEEMDRLWDLVRVGTPVVIEP